MDTPLSPRRKWNHAPHPSGWRESHAADCKSAHAGHDFLTHDQRAGEACELDFEDLDARERAIFLRCGFRPPLAA